MKHTLYIFLLLLVMGTRTQIHGQWNSNPTINTQVVVQSGSSQTRQDYAPIVSDGNGGAIIAWMDFRNGNSDIYVQCLDKNGNAKWTANGVAVCTDAAGQTLPVVSDDGSGGAIIAWEDTRNPSSSVDVYAQHIAANGAPLWALNGIPVCTATGSQQEPQIVSDGSNGAVIVWADYRNGTNFHIYGQKINSAGAAQWTATGAPILTGTAIAQNTPRITTDMNGGAIATWYDDRSSPGNGAGRDIYAQRINSSGVTVWTAGGVAVCTAPDVQEQEMITSDGNGGAIITWYDWRGGAFGQDIYAQKVNSAGVTQWTANGVAVCQASNQQAFPTVASDGSGGAIITWQDLRANTDWNIYTQRVNAGGSVAWTTNGIQLSFGAETEYQPIIINDGGTGAYIFWEVFTPGGTTPGAKAQHVNATGGISFASGGTYVHITPQAYSGFSPAAVLGCENNAIVCWNDQRLMGDLDVYAQNISMTGVLGSVCCLPPPSGMVAWWPLDETSGTTAADIAGVPNNGTHVGGPVPGAGKVAGALLFDGVDDYVEVANDAELNFGTGNFSIDAWIRTTDSLSVKTIVDKRTQDSTETITRGYSLYLFNGSVGIQLADGAFTNYNSTAYVANGQWHHIAVTVERANTNGIGFYRDGVLVGTNNPTAHLGSLTNTSVLRIGSRSFSVASLFNGTLDEIELFDQVLTPEEVFNIWQADSLGKCKPPGLLGSICGYKFNDLNGNCVKDSLEQGLLGWTINLSGPVSDSTTTDSLGLYCFTSLPAGTYTVSEVLKSGWTQTCPLPIPPGTYTVTLAPGQTRGDLIFGNRADSCVPPPQGMRGWWPGDNNTNDISGFNNNGTLQGGATYGSGRVGNAFTVTNATDYVAIPHHPSLNFDSLGFSIDAWVRTTDTTSIQTIIDKRAGTTDNPIGYHLFIAFSKLGFQMGDGQPFINFISSAPSIGGGAWHHVAVTVNRTLTNGGMLYVDGTPVLTFNPTTIAGSIANMAPLWFGQRMISSATPFRGQIDEVEIFNRALTPQEVIDIWQADSLGKCKPPGLLGSICGYKFNDVDSNGVYNSPPDFKLPNWKIKWTGPVVDSTFTDSLGNYCITNLPVGTYYVCEETQNGWTPTTAVCQTVVVGAGQTITVIFGNRLTTVGIIDEGKIPETYVLFQSYPNPFNPVTSIRYGLPEQSFVNLRIYDVLGREVAELVNEVQPAGYHAVDFDARSLSSGIYFYSIRSASVSNRSKNFTQAKKMLLLK